jgi:hypothetical protein
MQIRHQVREQLQTCQRYQLDAEHAVERARERNEITAEVAYALMMLGSSVMMLRGAVENLVSDLERHTDR